MLVELAGGLFEGILCRGCEKLWRYVRDDEPAAHERRVSQVKLPSPTDPASKDAVRARIRSRRDAAIVRRRPR